MFKNVHHDKKNNMIHLWEQVDGVDKYHKIKWVPYLFCTTNKKTNIKSITGKNVQKKTFGNYYKYVDYGINAKTELFENKIKVTESQFLAERYQSIPDDEIVAPNLKIYSIDIECDMVKVRSFPKTDTVENEISLITVFDCSKKKAVTFGCGIYLGNETKYIKCENEKELLMKFFFFMAKFPPDVITGWDVYRFDIPYIINRSRKLFPDSNIHYRMSPTNIVKDWSSDGSFRFDIPGVSIIDYLELYKWYSQENLESNKLDFVCQHELSVGKLDFSEYKDLRELSIKNWEKFVNYNVIDTKRVHELEEKLGYIHLVQYLSLLTKTPMRCYNTMTNLIEGRLLVYYRRNNLCAPFFRGGTEMGFKGGHVKHSNDVMCDWVVSIDIASSYPSHIITLNMSDEVYVGRIDMQEKEVVSHVRDGFFPDFILKKYKGSVNVSGITLSNFNKLLKEKKIAIAPCGTVFKTKPVGILPQLERDLFMKRKEFKKKMYESGNDKNLKKRYNAMQHALKIVLNAVFGACSVSYSRYFNLDIAEAITSCGRVTIKNAEHLVNEWLNNVDNRKKVKDIIKKYK